MPSGGRRVPDGDLDHDLAEDALQAEITSEARAKLAESLELARLIGDTRGIDTATLNLGWVELLEGDFDRAAPASRRRRRSRAAREAGLWRRGDLWLLSFGGSRWRCRPCRAPRGRRVRARRRCRIQPELLGHARSARKGCPRGPGRARLAEGLGRRCGARLRLRVQPGARTRSPCGPVSAITFGNCRLLAVGRE